MTRPLAIALTVTLVLALLPGAWLGRLGDVAVIVNFPLTPVRDGAGMIARWLRPAGVAEPADDGTDESLFLENEECRRRTRALALRIRELENQIEQLQLVPVAGFDLSAVTVLARVTSQDQSTPEHAVELNRGRTHGVTTGAIGVVDGVYLVGRVADVSPVRSVLVPLTSRTNGPLLARVVPAEGEPPPITDCPLVQLMPEGDGTFTADPAVDQPISVGDTVILDDASWPAIAQARILGRVRLVEPRDDQPLRHRVIVRPVHRPHRLGSVTLVMPAPGGEPPS